MNLQLLSLSALSANLLHTLVNYVNIFVLGGGGGGHGNWECVFEIDSIRRDLFFLQPRVKEWCLRRGCVKFYQLRSRW